MPYSSNKINVRGKCKKSLAILKLSYQNYALNKKIRKILNFKYILPKILYEYDQRTIKGIELIRKDVTYFVHLTRVSQSAAPIAEPYVWLCQHLTVALYQRPGATTWTIHT